mgnify:CR=1 FL=1
MSLLYCFLQGFCVLGLLKCMPHEVSKHNIKSWFCRPEWVQTNILYIFHVFPWQDFLARSSAKSKMLHFVWFLQYIVATGSVPPGQESYFKSRFSWPAWVQITFRCFLIKSVKLILKHWKVVCIHAGHQNHLLKNILRDFMASPGPKYAVKTI